MANSNASAYAVSLLAAKHSVKKVSSSNPSVLSVVSTPTPNGIDVVLNPSPVSISATGSPTISVSGGSIITSSPTIVDTVSTTGNITASISGRTLSISNASPTSFYSVKSTIANLLPTIGTAINFDTLVTSAGSNISFAPLTGIFSVAANNTYQLFAGHSGIVNTAVPLGFSFQWFDITANQFIGAASVASSAASVNLPNNSIDSVLYTPTQNSTLRLQVVANTNPLASFQLVNSTSTFAQIVQVSQSTPISIVTGSATMNGTTGVIVPCSIVTPTSKILVSYNLGTSAPILANFGSLISCSIISGQQFTIKSTNATDSNIVSFAVFN